MVSYSRPEQLRAQTPQFLNSLLKTYMNFTQHNLINIQAHAYQHSRANTEGGARRGSCPFGVGITMEELCRGWRQHLPLLPPSDHRTWLERRLKACVPPVGSRLFIPIQLPHLHRVWLAASNLGTFPLLKADVCKQCRFSSPPGLGNDRFRVINPAADRQLTKADPRRALRTWTHNHSQQLRQIVRAQ